MGRVFKPRRSLKDGRVWKSRKWYVEYRDAAGTQHRKPASDSKREARKLLTELESAAQREALGISPSSPPRKLLIRDLVERYLDDMKLHLRPNTLRDYDRSLKDLFLCGPNGEPAAFPINRVTALTPALVKSYQAKAVHQSSPRTVNKKLRAASQMLNWAVRCELIPSNPIANIRMLPQEPQKPLKALTDEEVERLLASSPRDAREIWEVFLHTGMRRGELTTLTWGDVDLKSSRLLVTADVSKNNKSRMIPMGPRVQRILRSRFADQSPSDSVFPSIEKWSNTYEGSIKVFKRCCRLAGLEGFTLHSLRRTFTVSLLEKGASPAVVQKLLGHATANLTLEVYAKVREGDGARAVSLFG